MMFVIMQKNEAPPDFHHDIHKVYTRKSRSSNFISSDAVPAPMNFLIVLHQNVRCVF